MKKMIGIDVGGTMIKGALIKEDVIEFKIFQLLDRRAPLESLWRMIEKLLIHAERKIEVIGIATAGRVDSKNGIVLYASPNIPNWSNLFLSKMVENKYGIPCFIINDARAAALAEAGSRNVSNMVLLTIGTGLGGGIVVDGKLIEGAHWQAGEIGHTILYPNGRRCNCGKKGCAEMYISMKVLHRYAKEKDRERLIEKFKQKDQNTVMAVEKMCRDIAVLIDRIFLTIDPQVVAIGGGFCELGSNALEILRKCVEPYSSKSLYNTSQVDLSILGNDAGIIGAVIYAKDRISRS
ncbi:MAG: glucokinase [Pseudothermotoga sp.]|nr:glucokinase [Pseudothermotoga sp.]